MDKQRKLATLSLFLLILVGIFTVGLVSAEFGTNWTGTFYNCVDLGASCGNTVAATASYPNGLNENWVGKPTASGVELTAVNADNFSARFTSSQTFSDGTYRFDITSADGVRVYIDGQLVLDVFVNRTTTTDTFEQQMTAGQHTLQVDYFNSTGTGVIQFQYNLVSSGTPVPTGTPIPPAQAEVVRVRGLAVRTGPYLGASLITVARPGNMYDILAQNNSEGIFTWYKIRVGERIGWSSGRYLQFNVPPDGVPFEGSVFDTLDAAPDTGVIAVPRAGDELPHPSEYSHSRNRRNPLGCRGGVA